MDVDGAMWKESCAEGSGPVSPSGLGRADDDNAIAKRRRE